MRCSSPTTSHSKLARFIVTAPLLTILAVACGGGPTVVADPDEPHVELRGNRIVFSHTIEFAHDSEVILEESFPMLDAVVGLLGEHPEIYRVQVQGHTSAVGEDAHNLELSTARAASVASYLSGHAVAQEVTSQGYGETYPLCREETDECNGQNRRVEFFVDVR